jgi:hypothetical protein
VKNFRLVPAAIFALAILPLVLLTWISSSILKKSIKSTVVNDPQAALTQSLNGLAGNVDKELNDNLLNALHFASKDSLKKALTGPVTSVTPFKNLSEAELGENPAALFVLADKKGNILYDNLGIPKPTPFPTPTGTVKKIKTHSKSKGLLLASAKDWPGMEVALAGSRQGGLLTLQGSIFLAFLVPVENKDKILGVVAIGSKIDGPLMKSFKVPPSTTSPFIPNPKPGVPEPLPPPPSIIFCSRRPRALPRLPPSLGVPPHFSPKACRF